MRIVIVEDDDITRSFIGMYGNDHIEGRGGNDKIFASNGDDIIEGNEGNDELHGEQGSDIYIFRKGDGIDTIVEYYDSSSNDIIKFLDIDSKEINIVKIGYDLEISVGEEKVIINDVKSYRIESLEFWQNDKLVEKLNYNEFINNLNVIGTDSNDYLRGLEKNNIFIGNKGNDKIYGQYADDKYIFNPGDGKDEIIDSNGNDKIIINNVPIENITFTREDNDLKITYDSDEIKINSYFWKNDRRIENIELWTNDIKVEEYIISDLISNDLKLMGSSTDDTLRGMLGDDTFEGGKGNDTLYGSDGNDTYIFNKGDGTDTIIDSLGFDKLKLIGFSFNEINFQKNSSNLEIISGEDKIIVKDFYLSYNNAIDTVEIWNNDKLEKTYPHYELIKLSANKINGSNIDEDASIDISMVIKPSEPKEQLKVYIGKLGSMKLVTDLGIYGGAGSGMYSFVWDGASDESLYEPLYIRIEDFAGNVSETLEFANISVVNAETVIEVDAEIKIYGKKKNIMYRDNGGQGDYEKYYYDSNE